MIRTYSDKLIVIEREINVLKNGTLETVIIAEHETRKRIADSEIYFYGELAENANEQLKPGMRFTYRGYVLPTDEGQIKLVGAAFAPIA